MADTYTLHIAGLTRELPICKVNDHLDIAAFIMFSDVELTEACAAALLKKAPEFDVILTAEAKGIPLAYEMARQSGKYWIPARKGPKLYMREPVIIEDQSITTKGKQKLVIDKKDIEYMDGKRILIVDDVISTGGSLHALETLAAIYGNVPHTRLPGLREMDFGDFEMKSYEELKDTPAYQAWITDVEHNPCPHGESAPQVLRRSLAAIAPVVQRPEDAVCVIHGGVTAGLMTAWFGGGRYDYSVSPGQGFQVTFREGQPVSYIRIPAAE